MKQVLIPAELYEALAAEATNERSSLEAITARAVEAHLEAIKTRRFFEERARRADPERALQLLD